MKKYDVIIIGAGAAGLSAARAALSINRKVLILDMGDKPARKVFVSGGGRCNFTNMAVSADRYYGKNPDFVRSVLARVKPTDILDWAAGHKIKWIEKAPGQFFSANGSQDVVDALVRDARYADHVMNTRVEKVEYNNEQFTIQTDEQTYSAPALIVATGGISYPGLDVSDVGYSIAKRFGHKIIPVEPGLVALKTNLFDPELAGLSLDVVITVGKKQIKDSLLFTHFGIGGPAAYRASMYDLNQDMIINFLPNTDVFAWLTTAKKTDGKKSLHTVLSQKLPAKFAKWLVGDNTQNIADYKDINLREIADYLNHYLIPAGSLKRRGLANAEVVLGGVSIDEISSKTMQSKLIPGLFFAGEVLDIAGDLGGFNLHWAFASGLIAGQNV